MTFIAFLRIFGEKYSYMAGITESYHFLGLNHLNNVNVNTKRAHT